MSGEKMKNRVAIALVCLHISAVIYLILGLGCLVLFRVTGFYQEDGDRVLAVVFAVVMLTVCVALAIGIEAVAFGLRRRKFWAWVAGLCIFGLYVPSLFLPLGALGLWGLLDPGSRAAFGIGGFGSPLETRTKPDAGIDELS
jgi:hypothetical protein